MMAATRLPHNKTRWCQGNLTRIICSPLIQHKPEQLILIFTFQLKNKPVFDVFHCLMVTCSCLRGTGDVWETFKTRCDTNRPQLTDRCIRFSFFKHPLTSETCLIKTTAERSRCVFDSLCLYQYPSLLSDQTVSESVSYWLTRFHGLCVYVTSRSQTTQVFIKTDFNSEQSESRVCR